jgi:hypothetical protein
MEIPEEFAGPKRQNGGPADRAAIYAAEVRVEPMGHVPETPTPD